VRWALILVSDSFTRRWGIGLKYLLDLGPNNRCLNDCLHTPRCTPSSSSFVQRRAERHCDHIMSRRYLSPSPLLTTVTLPCRLRACTVSASDHALGPPPPCCLLRLPPHFTTCHTLHGPGGSTLPLDRWTEIDIENHPPIFPLRSALIPYPFRAAAIPPRRFLCPAILLYH